ncbi:hypothetical protein [Microbacterium capsulatum]|uniref:Tetratricopeptide repeat protein n=1 Tax=Microbacterium capsulatum TaxID=3041921 RepID=A0ABU0XBE0_9MICO|nr:hypothetical protein [Microbacterium sp. ASV81]MDQ4212429.1 hypothetical protein [Microbacterium sp. ASV81]
MTSRIGVGLMAAVLVLYVAVAGWYAVALFSGGQPLAVTMGAALIALALIGGWALVRELQFGLAADRLGRALDAEGGMPEAPEELSPNGRLLPADAERLLAEYGSAAAESPADWRAQYRLGVVRDAAGRRKDARAAIREAIRLSKADRLG